MQTIDFKTAQSIYQNQGLENCPVPAINKNGMEEIKKFLLDYAKNKNQNFDEWYSEAEREAYDLLGGYHATIEIGNFYTIDKLPHILKLSHDFFDWAI